MADNADVYVRNVLTDDINVVRKNPDGEIDITITIAKGNEEKIFLASPEVSLVINGPEGMDTKECPVKVKSEVDLAVTHSRTDSNWTIKIVPNDLRPSTPTTVNIDIGEDET
jgi:hypothetical protein